MKQLVCLTLAVFLWSGSAYANTCTDACSSTRCTARAACDATYTTCFANANGDPLAEAACLQDRDACWTAADDAYLACVETCPFDECVDVNCGERFGPEITRCYDQHWACLMNSPPEVCDPIRDACLAEVQAQIRACTLNCATPCATVQVESPTWSHIKRLYRD